jgi:drug/metabolite transporter (DMT)-like permease
MEWRGYGPVAYTAKILSSQVAYSHLTAGRPRLILLKMVLVAFFWGGTFVAGRVVSAVLTPLDGAAVRFVFAGFGLVVALSYSRGWRAVRWRDWVLLVLLGLTGVVSYNLFFLAGMRQISASRAALITANNPAIIMLGAWLVFGEKLGLRRVGGIMLSLVGAMVVVMSRPELGASTGKWGELLIGGCVASWVCYTLLARKVLARVSPLTATAYSTFVGTLILFALVAPNVSVHKLALIPLRVWAASFFLGLFGTVVAYKWYMDGVACLGAGRAAQFINLVPVFAVALSMVILGERPSPMSLFGGSLVIGGLVITQASKGSARESADPS